MEMRFLPRLAMLFVVCLMALSLLAVPVEAVCRYPEISLSPDRGVPGDNVAIYGKDFDPDGYVDIYYYIDPTTRVLLEESIRPRPDRQFHVTVTIPESPTGEHKVRAIGRVDGQLVEKDAVLTVVPGLTVSPGNGPIGTNVTVQGHGFAANEAGIEVRRGLYETVLQDIEADGNGSWVASFEVPAWSQGQHEIRARGSKTVLIAAVSPALFRVGPGISVAETSGAVGQTIAVSGSGFAANEKNIRILLHGEIVAMDISADGTGRWEASFEVPEMPAGEYSVTAEGDVTRRSDVGEVGFAVKPGLALSPNEGHVGMNVTAAGRGFPTGKGVVILYEGSQVATTTTDAEGSFEVSFTVPQSKYGERQVTAQIAGGTNATAGVGTNATAIFVMESNHPATPELVSPADGHRVGIVFRARPTFEWSDVYDDSGVYYSLQVATSADFAPDSVVVSVTGLTETSYTLNEAQALPNGKYYWTVQAVDGAENESGWSEVNSFRAGRLPLWAFIVIIVVLALLLGLRAYFVLMRPRFYE